LESAQTNRRQHCLKPLDEVFTLGLGAIVVMAPLRASSRLCHGAAVMHLEHRTWRWVME
jgi:hypothetical protein